MSVVQKKEAQLGKQDMDGTVKRLNLVLKNLNTTLTKELDSKAPWDADIESQRLTIRGNYVRILLKFPDQADPRHLEALWIQTTHSIITRYRARIAAPLQPSKPSGPNNKKNRRDIQYEKNRNLSRFASFLKEEVKFYKTFIGRISSAYELESFERFLEGLKDENRSITSLDGIVSSKEVKSKAGAMVVRGFIFLGDLERYGEIYAVEKDSATKESEGQGRLIEQWLGTFEKQAEGFTKAKTMYQIAHLLDPDSGNPFNQLAVVATNQRDISGASYLYLRALAVKGFFPTANENLQRILRRPMDQFWSRLESDSHRFYHWDITTPLSFTEDFLILIGLFVVNSNKFCPSITYSTWFIAEYEYLLKRQSLPTEMILRMFVSLVAVHWAKRMTRRAPRSEKESLNGTAHFESAILNIILDIIIVTLDVVVKDLTECLDPVTLARYHNRKERIFPEGFSVKDKDLSSSKATDDSMDKFSVYLTVILRRSLPTLRVISKWIRSHQSYLSEISQDRPTLGPKNDESLSRKGTGKSLSCTSNTHRSQEKVEDMYRAYADLLNILNITFPSAEIVSLDVSLEEDFEMRGFGPTRKLMGFQFHQTGGMGREVIGSRGGHPNREYLMRISDLQKDGTYAAKGETLGLFTIRNGRFAYPHIRTFETKSFKDRQPTNIDALHVEITKEAWVDGRAGNASSDQLDQKDHTHVDTASETAPSDLNRVDCTSERSTIPATAQVGPSMTHSRSPQTARHKALPKEEPSSQTLRHTHSPKDISNSSTSRPKLQSNNSLVGSSSKPCMSASETCPSMNTPLESPVSINDLNPFPVEISTSGHPQNHPVSSSDHSSASDLKATDLAASLENSLLLRPETPSVQDEESASVSTGTEDDPVNRAMRATLDDESEVDPNELEQIREEARHNEEIELSAWSSSAATAAPVEIIHQGYGFPPSTNPIPSPNVTSTGKITALDLLNQITSSSGLPPASSFGGTGTPSPHRRPQSNLQYGNSMERRDSIWAPEKEEASMGRDSPSSSSGLGWSKPGEATWNSLSSIPRGNFGTPIGKGSPSGHPNLGGYEQSPFGVNQPAKDSQHLSSPYPQTFGRSAQNPPLNAYRSSVAEVSRSPTGHLPGYFEGQRDRISSLPNIDAGYLPHSSYQHLQQSRQQSQPLSSPSPFSSSFHQTYDPNSPTGLMTPSYTSSPSRGRQPSYPSPLGNMFTDQADPSSLTNHNLRDSFTSVSMADRMVHEPVPFGDHLSNSRQWEQTLPPSNALLQQYQQQQPQSTFLKSIGSSTSYPSSLDAPPPPPPPQQQRISPNPHGYTQQPWTRQQIPQSLTYNTTADQYIRDLPQQQQYHPQQEEVLHGGLDRAGAGNGTEPGMGYGRPGNMWG